LSGYIIARVGNRIVECPVDFVIALRFEREQQDDPLLVEAEAILQDAASYLDTGEGQ
jgi:hypothetical protein